MATQQNCYQSTVLPLQCQGVPRQFFERPFTEDLGLPHSRCGSPVYGVHLRQPLLNLKSTNTVRLERLVRDEELKCLIDASLAKASRLSLS
jgi:hypothetical protein